LGRGIVTEDGKAVITILLTSWQSMMHWCSSSQNLTISRLFRNFNYISRNIDRDSVAKCSEKKDLRTFLTKLDFICDKSTEV
jgi:hypothetical protein